MNQPVEQSLVENGDSIQERLTSYAQALNYDQLNSEVVHAAKVRVIDTFGSMIAGYFAEPCQIARKMAARMANPEGATVIGTRMKATPDMAAFTNCLAARFIEMTDVYHWPGSYDGHPSDTLMPVLSAAELVRSSGREYIAALVLAYEVFLRIADVFPNRDFDNTTFGGLAVAIGAGKLMGLSAEEMAHCISLAVIPNNSLRQTRLGHLTMWKAGAAAHAGRAGMFAALMAQAGMEGPHLPFVGKAGWCDHVARKRFSLDLMGGGDTPFKILNTSIKQRASCATTISSILAAEKIAPFPDVDDIKDIAVEVYKKVKEEVGTGENRWNPDSRETADHSAPYVVAATLLDGTITPRSFDDAHLNNPRLRALIHKIKVVENDEFTRAVQRYPVEHRTRITVTTVKGRQVVGESGGDKGDLSDSRSDSEIEQKFRSLAEDVLGARRTSMVLDRLWNLEAIGSMDEVPPLFVLA